MKKASREAKASPSAPLDPAQPLMLKRNAVMLCLIALLAGLFVGWQAAVIVFNQEMAQASLGGMHQQQAQGMPPGQGGAAGGGNPMNNPLMAQAKTLEERVLKTPNDPKAWAELGNIYYDAGLPDRSVAAYQKSLALSPNQPDVWTDMGVMQRELKQFKEALASFQQAATLDPRHEPSRLNIGVVMLDLGDPQGAVKAWKDLLAVNAEARLPSGKKVAEAIKELPGGGK